MFVPVNLIVLLLIDVDTQHKHHDDDWEELKEQLNRFEEKLNRIERKLQEMALDQATFDTDLAALVQSITDLTTAVDAFIANIPVTDMTAEDQSVQAAAAAVAAELAKIVPAPVPGP